MKTLSIFLLSAILFAFVASSQNQYSFRVLANKGQNSIKFISSDYDWQPLKTGVKLYKGDEVMVSTNGYVGLVHVSGKTIELKSAGMHSISELITKLNASSTSLASKYAEFIFSQNSKDENPKNNNKVSGSVDRAAAPIRVFAPTTNYIHSPIAIIKWEAPKTATEFVVTVKNLFESTLITEQTKESSYTLDLNDPKLKNESLLIVNVKAKNDNKIFSNDIGIKKLPEDELRSINKDFNSLQAETADETPLNKVIHATFYEQHNLLLDAITSYEIALKLAPDVEDFKTAYDLFLTRNNLKHQ